MIKLHYLIVTVLSATLCTFSCQFKEEEPNGQEQPETFTIDFETQIPAGGSDERVILGSRIAARKIRSKTPEIHEGKTGTESPSQFYVKIQREEASSVIKPDQSNANVVKEGARLASESAKKSKSVPFSGPLQTYPRLSSFPTSKIDFSYGNQVDDLPPLTPLAEIEVPLGPESSSSLRELLEGDADPVPLSFKDLHLISQVALQYYESLGYQGIVVFPDPLQIDPVSRRDLRGKEDTTLRIIIWLSVLKEFSVEHKGFETGDLRISESQETVDELMNGSGWADKPLRSGLFRFGRRYDRAPFQKASTRIVPAGNPGEVNAVLEIENRKRFGGVVSVANSGTESLGRWNFGGGVEWYPLANGSDSASASWSVSDTLDRQAYGLTYRTEFLRPGVLSGGVRLFHSKYDASSFAITRIDFEGATDSAEAFLDYRPLEWETENSSVQLFGSIKTERVTASNSLSSLKADARFLVPELGIRFSKKGRYFQSQSSLALKANLNSVTDSDRTALGGIDSVSLSRRLSLDEKLKIKIGQWYSKIASSEVSDALKKHFMILQFHASLALKKARHLPQHQFVLGGTGSVRGYPEYPAAGDNGYRLAAEYNVPLGELSGLNGDGFGEVSLIPFIDFGETFVENPQSWESDKTLLGAGLGIQMRLPSSASLRVDLAKPLREIRNNGSMLKGTGSGDGRVHAMLTWAF